MTGGHATMYLNLAMQSYLRKGNLLPAPNAGFAKKSSRSVYRTPMSNRFDG